MDREGIPGTGLSVHDLGLEGEQKIEALMDELLAAPSEPRQP